MSYPDLPLAVKKMTASKKMRWRHRYWHLVKNERFVNNPNFSSLVEALANIGWKAEFTGGPGAGLDFLYMHRVMIGHVDHMLMSANDPNWPKVTGWDEIPESDNDQHWPEPNIPGLNNRENWPPELIGVFNAVINARSTPVKTNMLALAKRFRDVEYLSDPETSLDKLGHEIEVTVHNWMHMRFSAMPPANRENVDISNDWLGDPFSSHVNPYFWKLHGWIDDCITHWESARGEVADFSSAWRAPTEAPPWDELETDPELMAFAKSHKRRNSFLDIVPFEAPTAMVETAIKRIKG